jgi:hypothetical protein
MIDSDDKPDNRVGLFEEFCKNYATEWNCLGLVFSLPSAPQSYKLSAAQEAFFDPAKFKAIAFIIIFPHSALSKHACEIIQLPIDEISTILMDINTTLSEMLLPQYTRKRAYIQPKLHEHHIKSVDQHLFRSRLLGIFGYKKSKQKGQSKLYSEASSIAKTNLLMEQMMEWKANNETEVHRNAKKLIATLWFHQRLGDVNMKLIEEIIQRLHQIKFTNINEGAPS